MNNMSNTNTNNTAIDTQVDDLTDDMARVAADPAHQDHQLPNDASRNGASVASPFTTADMKNYLLSRSGKKKKKKKLGWNLAQLAVSESKDAQDTEAASSMTPKQQGDALTTTSNQQCDALPKTTSSQWDNRLTIAAAQCDDAPTPEAYPRKLEFSTPSRDNNDERLEWVVFCKKNNMTPPAEIHRPMSKIIEVGDEILTYAPDGPRQWDDLNTKQTTCLAWMLNERFDSRFETKERARVRINDMLFSDSELDKGTKAILWSFVRKGGDEVVEIQGENGEDGIALYKQLLQDYRDIFPKDGTQWTSIFEKYAWIKPLLKVQSDHSAVCMFLTMALNIHYIQNIRHGEHAAPNLKNLSMNVARSMRLLHTPEEKFDTIFNGEGFKLERTMDMILRGEGLNSELKNESLVNELFFCDNDDRNDLYLQINIILKHGPMFLAGFRQYDGYATSDKCISKGTKELSTGMLHAVTVVGAALTEDEYDEYGGLAILIQDCSQTCPFKIVGLSLLIKMGLKTFTYIRRSVELPSGDLFDVPSSATRVICGTPNVVRAACTRQEENNNEKAQLLFRQIWQHGFNNDVDAVPPWARQCQQSVGDENEPPSK